MQYELYLITDQQSDDPSVKYTYEDSETGYTGAVPDLAVEKVREWSGNPMIANMQVGDFVEGFPVIARLHSKNALRVVIVNPTYTIKSGGLDFYVCLQTDFNEETVVLYIDEEFNPHPLRSNYNGIGLGWGYGGAGAGNLNEALLKHATGQTMTIPQIDRELPGLNDLTSKSVDLDGSFAISEQLLLKIINKEVMPARKN